MVLIHELKIPQHALPEMLFLEAAYPLSWRLYHVIAVV